LKLDIPGWGALRLEHLVLDYNGTLAIDGELLPGVRTRVARLARALRIHVLTADTFGKASRELGGLPCELVVLAAGGQDRAKAAHVRQLGLRRTACIGNGRNDRLMLRAAALAIATVQVEGAAVAALVEADLMVKDVRDALDLLLNPLRLVATLRT
jgi:soluble P-type ATPase